MFGEIFKRKVLHIPTNDTNTITEIVSYSVKWEIRTGWSNTTQSKIKVFIDQDEADQFAAQLKK